MQKQSNKTTATRITRDSITGLIDGQFVRVYIDTRRDMDTGAIVSATPVSITDEHGNDLTARFSDHVRVSHFPTMAEQMESYDREAVR